MVAMKRNPDYDPAWLHNEIARLREELNEVRLKWQAQFELGNRLREEIERLKDDLRAAQEISTMLDNTAALQQEVERWKQSAQVKTLEARLAQAREALERIVRHPCANEKCACCQQDADWATFALHALEEPR